VTIVEIKKIRVFLEKWAYFKSSQTTVLSVGKF